ncbi:hypothetical protein GWI33_009318 [Rhynchophorus ferrugineus]|uniref:Uncharacterized protein n=1 Tax=Rhynchophorus ferrugineus TaxID=354439 RepID=A0A834IPL4_RHYFE|nr:hypothetical protein GWI33_009318 [Rhynchophorus ferrugineus]
MVNNHPTTTNVPNLSKNTELISSKTTSSRTRQKIKLKTAPRSIKHDPSRVTNHPQYPVGPPFFDTARNNSVFCSDANRNKMLTLSPHVVPSVFPGPQWTGTTPHGQKLAIIRRPGPRRPHQEGP